MIQVTQTRVAHDKPNGNNKERINGTNESEKGKERKKKKRITRWPLASPDVGNIYTHAHTQTQTHIHGLGIEIYIYINIYSAVVRLSYSFLLVKMTCSEKGIKEKMETWSKKKKEKKRKREPSLFCLTSQLKDVHAHAMTHPPDKEFISNKEMCFFFFFFFKGAR